MRICSAILFSFVLTSAPAYLQAEPAKFLGVASCSSSNCHGGAGPRNGSHVLQNEYVTWVKHDTHAQAWRNLTSEDSKKIAKNLGIKDASTDKLCLQCHSTYVSDPALHGEKYNIEDGVGCESCHGASEHWISKHTEKGADHKKNVSNGMLDIVPLEARAKLCVSCHYGTDEKSVNHGLIGAGHPRLAFELDTFGMIQPRHWNHDQDYADRKLQYEPIKAWLTGQVTLAREMIAALRSDKRSRNGIMPELSLFTCYACHHSLLGDQWKVRDYAEKPGELRLNLAPLLTIREALQVLDKPLATKLEQGISELHNLYKSGKGEATLAKLETLLGNEALPLISKLQMTDERAKGLLGNVVHFAADTPYFQYEEAEQLAMGVSAIVSQLDPASKLHKAEVDALYKALKTPEDFQAEAFTASAKDFSKKL